MSYSSTNVNSGYWSGRDLEPTNNRDYNHIQHASKRSYNLDRHMFGGDLQRFQHQNEYLKIKPININPHNERL
jgi:hypothetical protein